ncbi:sensor histidine kinase [Actinokineospora inagensis]|uniref:sensor histidine kinase n=1 Tax=Actinokineospora inagensis TaxID=103730 RepID=UPI000408D19A|nr:sensor histidine kinase [Actinokineospora inagensis]
MANDDDPIFSAAVRHDVLESFRQRLVAVRSPLAANGERAAQLWRQADSVLDDVAADIAGVDFAPSGHQAALTLSTEIGVSRADHGVRPVESLKVAAIMFDVLLPVVYRESRARSTDERAATLRAATSLHASILHRFGLGAVSYASFLLKKVSGSHRDERHRIARELHDQAAHAVGVALQQLELHEAYQHSDPPMATKRLESAQAAMREALDVVRNLARELRESAVETGGLERALSAYLSWQVPADIRAGLSVTGDLTVPGEVSQELYFVLREAIRNTVLHAGARNLEVVVAADAHGIRAMVHDDGRGFDVTAAMSQATGVGLWSMRERLELLDGTLDIDSAPGKGTVISIHIAHFGPTS